MRVDKVWIVEILNDSNGEWEPTVGCSLTREEARISIRTWRGDNKSDKFRIAQYERKKRSGRK